jgi:hypothetical protein
MLRLVVLCYLLAFCLCFSFNLKLNANSTLTNVSSHFTSCIKIKQQAPHLNLNCDDLKSNQNELYFKNNNNRFNASNDNFVQNISTQVFIESSKRITKKDEEKLYLLLKQLKED